MLYVYNGILLGLKKEGNSDTYYDMDEPWEYCAKWIIQSQKDKYYMIPLIWGTLSG